MNDGYRDARDYPPEELRPNGNEVLLVGITRRGEFHYYVLPRHLLYLDGRRAVINGHDSAFYAGIAGRYDIMIVNKAHEDAFFQAIEPHKRSPERLRDEVYTCKNKYWRAGYYTEVLIDFDRKHLVSYYGEPYDFEKDVPEGWSSERPAYGCGDAYYFMDDDHTGKPEQNIGIGGLEQDYIPLDKRFWIDENGKSIFRLLYEEGLRTGCDKPYVPPPANRTMKLEDWIKKFPPNSKKREAPPVDLDWIPEDVQFWKADNERNLSLCLYVGEVRSGKKRLDVSATIEEDKDSCKNKE